MDLVVSSTIDFYDHLLFIDLHEEWRWETQGRDPQDDQGIAADVAVTGVHADPHQRVEEAGENQDDDDGSVAADQLLLVEAGGQPEAHADLEKEDEAVEEQAEEPLDDAPAARHLVELVEVVVTVQELLFLVVVVFGTDSLGYEVVAAASLYKKDTIFYTFRSRLMKYFAKMFNRISGFNN